MVNLLYRLLPFAYFCLIFSFIGGQLGRISFFNQRLNSYVYELFLIIYLILLFILYKTKPLKISFKKIPILYIFFGYILISLLISSFWFNLQANAIALLYFIRLTIYSLFPIYFFYSLKDKNVNVSLIEKFTLLTAIVFIIFCFIQYLFLPDLRPLEYLGWDEHLYRMFGTFLEPVILGSLFSLICFFILSRKISHQQAKYSSIVLLGVGILLTFARTIYMGWSIAFIVYLATQKQFKLIFLFVALFLIGLFLVPKPFGEGVNLLRNSTIDSRLVDYQHGIAVWKTHPFLGIGYNHIASVKNIDQHNSIQSHGDTAYQSSFLTMLVTTGVVGIILMLGVLVSIARLNAFARLCIIFLSIVSLGDNVLLHPFILFPFGLLLSFSLVNLFDS